LAVRTEVSFLEKWQMSDVSRRVKKVEKKLSLNEEHVTVNIVHFGGELPPDHTDGNIAVHYVSQDEEARQ